MKVTIENGELVIRVPMNAEPLPESSTGKTLVVASSRGNKTTTLKVAGRSVVVGLNAYVYAEKPRKRDG